MLGTSTRTSNVAIKSPDAVIGRWRGMHLRGCYVRLVQVCMAARGHIASEGG